MSAMLFKICIGESNLWDFEQLGVEFVHGPQRANAHAEPDNAPEVESREGHHE